MPELKSQINTRSVEFKANADAMRKLVEDLRAKVDAAALGGGEATRAKHTARGKLLPRDRVAQLLDPGTPFLEIGQLAAHGSYDGDAPSAGVIAGIGRIQGIDCMVVVANDATVKDTCGPSRLPSRTSCRATTSSTPAARSCRSRTRSLRSTITSGASSSIRPTCRPRVFRRSRS